MELTFLKEIEWAAPSIAEDTSEVVESIKSKEATFKELNRFDKTQAKLHFKIISMFEGMQDDQKEEIRKAKTPEEKSAILENSDISINSDALYDITVKAVNQLLVVDEKFTANDKDELINDSIALLNLGLWLFANKFAPFFQKLRMS